MKNSNLNNIDIKFSLYNVENYKQELSSSISEVSTSYFNLLEEYYKFIIENLKIKKKHMINFIIIRGLETITNVFLNLLLYTKNLDLTYFHCQKSFYFYVEFVGQISEDEKMFLQLTSRDASVYLYKKTIFEITPEFKKMNENITHLTSEKFNLLNFYINLCKNYFIKLIQNNKENNNNERLLNIIKEILNKLNSNLVKIDKLKILISIIDNLCDVIENLDFLLETNLCLINKFLKNANLLNNYEKKIITKDFINQIDELDVEKLINLILN
jgi:hypothetical protein